MPNYKITANGTEMGTFEADEAAAARLAYVKDAGYGSVPDAAAALDLSVTEFLDQILVEEVESWEVVAPETGDVLATLIAPSQGVAAREYARSEHGRTASAELIQGDPPKRSLYAPVRKATGGFHAGEIGPRFAVRRA